MFKSLLFIILALLLLIPLHGVSAQNALPGTDTVFGFDPVLYNGRIYTYQPPRYSTGHPYLFDSFREGWVHLTDRRYNDLNLNYDIFNQVLLLKYVDHAGATVVIEVSESWMNSFGIGNSTFEFREKGGLHPVIYQVIGSGPVKVLYHWQKELNLENVTTTPVYGFSASKRNSSVNINGKEFAYEKNREFIKAFNNDHQVKIRNYLKINKIKVKKSSDTAIGALVNYCNTLLNP